MQQDIFNFSLVGILGFKEHTNESSHIVQLANDLGINIVAVGTESKETLTNLSISSGLLKNIPETYSDNKEINTYEPTMFTSNQVLADFKVLDNRKFSLIPSITSYDTLTLIKNLNLGKCGYLGRNQLILKAADLSITHTSNLQEVKASCDLITMSDKGLDDIFNAVIEMKNAKKVTTFIFQSIIGSIIPSLFHIVICLYTGLEPSSFGILSIDFGVSAVSQLLYVSFPPKIPINPIRNWITISFSAFFTFIYMLKDESDYKYSPHGGYFLTIFMCFAIHTLWIRVNNIGKMYTAWSMVHTFVGLKCAFFFGFLLIAKVSTKVMLGPVSWSYLPVGVLFYTFQLILAKYIG